MITIALLGLFHAFGITVFFLGLQGLIFVPLTILYEIRKRYALRAIKPFTGRVTVLVPAYNEERTIRATITSILDSRYKDIEVIVVNDGSTDSTEDVIRDFIDSGRIRYIKKTNGGKASALNMGIEAATGEVVVYTDADSIFLPDTVDKMVRWFGDPSIDAVCGNDTPLAPATMIQRFLAVTTHIGTGFVRRALSAIGSLPIITGNLGAVRTRVLREIGGFREIWGEDLEITFRLHKKRKKIIFDPDPKVVAECPGTLRGLWKQRVRWMRSYIKIVLLHRDLFFNPKWKPFSFYLPVNFLNMAVVPLLQLVLAMLLPWAFATENIYFIDTVEVLTYLGIIFFFFIAFYSILLDRAYGDLVYIPYGLLIIPISYFYNAVTCYSWWEELKKAEERWEKVERRRVVFVERRGLGLAFGALLLVLLSSGATYYYVTRIKGPAYVSTSRYRPAFELALSTHFDAWGDWRDAIRSIRERPYAGLARVVGVGAGRPEWTYFKWKGRKSVWSNHQKGAKEDLLYTAARTFHRDGYKVAAIVDLYAPKYIEEHPDAAAIGYDGEKSTEQVSFMEVVRGDYGRLVLDMVEYLCANYPVDIINLTELSYYSASFNPWDLASYKTYQKKDDWPRTPDGLIDRDDPSIWQWRSALMEEFIKKVAGVVHRYGRELYIDVPVSWRDFTLNGMDSGLDYRRILKHADKIIIWNYFYIENAPPQISEPLAMYLVDNFPAGSFYLSIGLWGDKEPVDPDTLEEAIKSTLKGGVRRIWITPDSLMTGEHWKRVINHLKVEEAPPPAG